MIELPRCRHCEDGGRAGFCLAPTIKAARQCAARCPSSARREAAKYGFKAVFPIVILQGKDTQ